MRFPGLILTLMSLGGLGGCFIAPPFVSEPEPPQLLSDAGSPGPGDAGSVFPEDAGSEPETDGGDPEADTGPAADPSCPIDELENDDSLAQTRNQRSFMHLDRSGPTQLTGLTACLEDEDWLRIGSDGAAHDPVGAIVRWDPAVGSLEVDILDSKGAPLALDAPRDIVERRPGEVRLLRARSGITVIVRVRANGGVSVPYSADIYSPLLLH